MNPKKFSPVSVLFTEDWFPSEGGWKQGRVKSKPSLPFPWLNPVSGFSLFWVHSLSLNLGLTAEVWEWAGGRRSMPGSRGPAQLNNKSLYLNSLPPGSFSTLVISPLSLRLRRLGSVKITATIHCRSTGGHRRARKSERAHKFMSPN